MAQQVGDADLVRIRKVGHVFRQRIVQFELSALDELQHCHRRESLGDGGKAEDCAGRIGNRPGNVGHAIGLQKNHLTVPDYGDGRAWRFAPGDRAEELVDPLLRVRRSRGAQRKRGEE